MALFNPFGPIFSNSFSNIPVQQPFYQHAGVSRNNFSKESLPKFNEQQFYSMLPALTNEHLQNIVAQARLQGISEKEIEEGLSFIAQLKQQK